MVFARLNTGNYHIIHHFYIVTHCESDLALYGGSLEIKENWIFTKSLVSEINRWDSASGIDIPPRGLTQQTNV